MPMKVREVIRLLEQNGWVEMRSKREPSPFQTSQGGVRRHSARQPGQRTGDRHAERYTQKGRSEINVRRYPVIIEQTATGYSAYSPDVPRCAAVGDTPEETCRNFQDALAAHFEAMREVGE